MTYIQTARPAPVPQQAVAEPIRKILVADLPSILRAGLADFTASPTHTLFLIIIYPIIGLVLARLTMGENLMQLAYPLVAGFALLGPFAAVGLYELSRRRERGLDLSWSHAADIFRSPQFSTVAALGAVQLLIFVAWMAVAHGLYTGLFAHMQPHSIAELFRLAFTTHSGWALIVVGNGLGSLFAAAALTLSVVSFPLAIDRPVSAVTAIKTSIRAVQVNPVPMAVWGLIVALSLGVGFATLFIGLAVILPVLGHATWHLYRAVVAPSSRT